MRAIVDEETCIGCGRCVEICPDVFELEGEIAINKIGEVPTFRLNMNRPVRKPQVSVRWRQLR